MISVYVCVYVQGCVCVCVCVCGEPWKVPCDMYKHYPVSGD